MSTSLKLPPDITAAVVKVTADSIVAQLAPTIEEMQLITLTAACELLGVGKTKGRSLITEYVDLGEKSPRVSVAAIRRLIASRTIKSKLS